LIRATRCFNEFSAGLKSAVNNPPKQKMKPTKTTTPPIKNSISRSPLRCGFLLVPLALAWFALSPTARAVSPAPDGGYPNGNTAEGTGALSSLTSGSYDTAMGLQALFSNTTGFYNTGTGVNALFNNTGGAFNTANGGFALFSNTTGNSNTATGQNALVNNTTASYDTAMGYQSLFSNTTGTSNTGTGVNALFSNTTGLSNTATGVGALFSNTTATFNTATGFAALFSNTIGFQNTATGTAALYHDTTGGLNTANGDHALFSNTTGDLNSADGGYALYSTTTGNDNTANGFEALFSNTTGSSNTATGVNALINNTTGHDNIAVGVFAGSSIQTGINNIDIGNQGFGDESDTIRIGTSQTKAVMVGIYGGNPASALPVYVNSSGLLGTPTSSARFKTNIRSMGDASEVLLALHPVTFQYKPELDSKGIPQFGLVAEEVEKVNPDLVVRDAEGKVYSVRYEAVNAMLLNEFLKEHRTVEEQGATIAKQQKQIEALTAGLLKMSARIKVSKSAPQIVADNQ
jgi:hypothetical protein